MALILAPPDNGASPAIDRTATDGGALPPSIAVRPRPARRSGDGWRSRCLATAAYLLTLAGLLAVAATGSERDMAIPITRNGDRVVSSGLVGVLEQVAADAAQP